jgi:hypothetical protein
VDTRLASPAPAGLSRWGEVLSCYTAALAVWLAVREDRWWRPLLAGGPVLAVTPDADGLLRFEHHRRPPLAALGLTVRYTDYWAAAHAAYQAELARSGALIVCGDVHNLPWQRGHRRWHASHWFTVVRHDHDWLVDDPLAMSTLAGPQQPSRTPVRPGQLARWSLAPPAYSPVQRLREWSMAGYEPPGLDARYRWLTAGEVPGSERPADPARLAGADAVTALADRLRVGSTGDPVYRQADDLWQALRQRELLVAAAEVDADLLPPAAAEQWRRAIAGWRRIPPVLMHARLRAEAGLPVDRARVADTMLAVAPFEGRWPVRDEMVDGEGG